MSQQASVYNVIFYHYRHSLSMSGSDVTSPKNKQAQV